MNKAFLKGNCGSDPEVKKFDWGKVAKFSLATSEKRKKNEETVTETTWHNLVFFGDICDVLEKYVHKGDQLLVEGKIVTRQYTDKNGVNHYGTEIVCDRFEFCGSPKDQKSSDKQGQYQKSGKVDVKAMSNIDDLPY